MNGNNGSNIICSFTTVSLAAIISIYLLVLLFTHMWIESQFTRSSHALFNYGSGCDSFTLKFSRNRERKTIFLRCTLLAVDSSKNEGNSKSENIVFCIFFLFIFLWNVIKKFERGTRFKLWEQCFEARPAAQIGVQLTTTKKYWYL